MSPLRVQVRDLLWSDPDFCDHTPVVEAYWGTWVDSFTNANGVLRLIVVADSGSVREVGPGSVTVKGRVSP